MRYPLVDAHGNFGSVDGDGPAAMRYTECRLSKVSMEMVNGIKKNLVDFRPNFDETEKEPVVLPTRLPNLLINPTSGIAVGMACSHAPHNLTEVVNAACALIENPKMSIDDILGYISGPDFPGGGIIINQNELPAAYKTGKGRARVRGKYHVEKNLVVFDELPFGVSKEALSIKIAELYAANEIDGLSDARDESDKNGIRYVIECKKGVNPDSVANKLFAKTDLEKTYSINAVAIVDGSPRLLNVKQELEYYIEHQKDIVTRRTKFDLEKAKSKLHILEGLLIALEDIDNIIALIKSSKSAADAKLNLQNKYKLSEPQSEAVVEMKLRKLASLEKVEIKNESAELQSKVDELENILKFESSLNETIIKELKEIIVKHGDKRRTEITNITTEKEEKEIAQVIPEDMVIVLSKDGAIKRIPTKSFRVQKKNGKGMKINDVVLDVIKTNTIDTLIMFSSAGKMYRLLVDNIPVGTNASRGTPVEMLVNLEKGESIVAITSLYRKTNAKYVVFATKNGMIKKTLISEYFKTKRNTGIVALNIKDGDELAGITFLDEEELVLITEQGMSIRFTTKDIAPIGRVAMGVKGIKLAEGDAITAMLPVNKTTDYLAVFSNTGLAKKVSLEEFPLQGRGGKGTYVYKADSKTWLVGAEMVSEEDNILVIGPGTSICISSKDIPKLGKPALGNIMIKDSEVTSVTKL